MKGEDWIDELCCSSGRVRRIGYRERERRTHLRPEANLLFAEVPELVGNAGLDRHHVARPCDYGLSIEPELDLSFEDLEPFELVGVRGLLTPLANSYGG